MTKERKTILSITGLLIFVLILSATFILIHNLNKDIASEKEQNKAWEKSYKALDSETTNKINDCEHIISGLKEKVDEQNTTIVNLTKQVETLKKDNNELRIRIDDYDKKAKEEVTTEAPVIECSESSVEPQAYVELTGGLTPTGGVYWYGEQKETWYNLPMEGVIAQAQNNGIYGEYWIRDDGVKMYGDYIMLACNRSVHPMGSLVETSLGTGISLDTGAFADINPYQVDIAVNWVQ